MAVTLRENSKGFTLAEVMVVTLIIGLLFSAGAVLIVHVTRFYRINDAKLRIQGDARQAMAALVRGLRQAEATSVKITTPPGQPPASRIKFSRYVRGQGAVEEVSFYQEGNKLLMQVTGGGVSTLSENLRAMAFTYPKSSDLSVLNVSIYFEKKTYEGQEKALQMVMEKVRLMNQ